MCQCVHIPQVPDVRALLESFLANGAHVNILDRCVRELLRVVERRQAVESLIGTLATPMWASRGLAYAWSEKMRLGEYAEREVLPTWAGQ